MIIHEYKPTSTPSSPTCLDSSFNELVGLFSKCTGQSTGYYQFVSNVATSSPLSSCVTKLISIGSALIPKNTKLLQFYSNPLRAGNNLPDETTYNPLQTQEYLNKSNLARNFICTDEVILDENGNSETDVFSKVWNFADGTSKTITYPTNFYLNMDIDKTKLQLAIQQNSTANVSKHLAVFLAHRQFDPNFIGANTFTPLTLNIQDNKASNVKLLLSHPKIDPNKADGEGQTPLHIATAFSLVSITKELLKHKDIDPNKVSGLIHNGLLTRASTPLINAIRKGSLQIVEAMLAHSLTDIDKAACKTCPSPLKTASEYSSLRNKEEIKALIKQHKKSD